MSLVFLDTETTGLNPQVHDIWEVAFAVDYGKIHSGVIEHCLHNADQRALELNGYHQRANQVTHGLETELRKAVTGNTIVGANPAFDTSFLRVRWHGETPWHYRLFDIEAYAAGVWRLDYVPGLKQIKDRLSSEGYILPEPDHTARGDVETLRAVYTMLKEYPRD